tara:strand:+ start:774 stop:1250 length:477 start_codon:yes stop_codon:yes gene_type:complete
MVEGLLEVPSDPARLLESHQLSALRLHLSQEMDKLSQFEKLGFFIISPDRISIASMRDENIGTVNLIHQQRKDLLDKVFNGEMIMIPPIVSDVILETGTGQITTKGATMFFVSPIRNADNKVIAALALRINPARGFSRLTQFGRMLKSGETYAFDNTC